MKTNMPETSSSPTSMQAISPQGDNSMGGRDSIDLGNLMGAFMELMVKLQDLMRQLRNVMMQYRELQSKQSFQAAMTAYDKNLQSVDKNLQAGLVAGAMGIVGGSLSLFGAFGGPLMSIGTQAADKLMTGAGQIASAELTGEAGMDKAQAEFTQAASGSLVQAMEKLNETIQKIRNELVEIRKAMTDMYVKISDAQKMH